MHGVAKRGEVSVSDPQRAKSWAHGRSLGLTASSQICRRSTGSGSLNVHIFRLPVLLWAILLIAWSAPAAPSGDTAVRLVDGKPHEAHSGHTAAPPALEKPSAVAAPAPELAGQVRQFTPQTMAKATADKQGARASHQRRGFGELIQVVESTAGSFDGDVRDLPVVKQWRPGDPVKEYKQKGDSFHYEIVPPRNPPAVKVDPLLDVQRLAEQLVPQRAFSTPNLNFGAQDFSGVKPPDTNGDIGKNYYMQAINNFGAGLCQLVKAHLGAR